VFSCIKHGSGSIKQKLSKIFKYSNKKYYNTCFEQFFLNPLSLNLLGYFYLSNNSVIETKVFDLAYCWTSLEWQKDLFNKYDKK